MFGAWGSSPDDGTQMVLRQQAETIKAMGERIATLEGRVDALSAMFGKPAAKPADEGTDEQTVVVTIKQRATGGRLQLMLTSDPTPNEIGPARMVRILREMLMHYEAEAAQADMERGNQQAQVPPAMCPCGIASSSMCNGRKPDGSNCTMLRHGI